MPDAHDKRPHIGAKSHGHGGRGGDKPHAHGGGDADIAALADRQHGVLTYGQLVALGFGRRAIQHRVSAGRLHRLHQGVYSVGVRKLTPQGHRMAAALTYGPGAVISHRTAAAVWGLRPTSQTKIDVTVLGYGRRSRAKIRVHGTTKLHSEDSATVDGIPVTSVARTLLDLSSTLNADRLLRMIEQAVQLGLFDLNALDRASARTPRRSGIKGLRSVLAAYREPPRTRSELEREFFDLISASGLPQPLINAKLAGLEVDFLWPSGLVVELDGRAYHTSPRAFEHDRIRDAKLQRAGCKVLRITYRRLRADPFEVLEDVRALLALAA